MELWADFWGDPDTRTCDRDLWLLALLREPALSGEAHAVGSALADWMDPAGQLLRDRVPSMPQLAGAAGVEVLALASVFRELIEQGWLIMDRRAGKRPAFQAIPRVLRPVPVF